jgi:pimeloyl-ACP methyl ester carboxylesterase
LATVEHGQIFYDVSGSGPPVVLLHAGVAHSRMWDEQVKVFSRRHTVVRYDLRGFGRSPAASGSFAHYRDVSDLLTMLGIDKAHLVGLSFGGRVAIDFALAYPDKVRSLVLASAAIGGAEPSAEMREYDRQESALLEKGDRERAADLNVRTWVVGHGRSPAAVPLGIRTAVRTMQLENYAVSSSVEAKSVRLDPPAITRLEQIHVPTLVLVGDRDMAWFQELAQTLARRIPGAEKRGIPNVAHMINLEQPDLFDRLVQEFLAKH